MRASVRQLTTGQTQKRTRRRHERSNDTRRLDFPSRNDAAAAVGTVRKHFYDNKAHAGTSDSPPGSFRLQTETLHWPNYPIS